MIYHKILGHGSDEANPEAKINIILYIWKKKCGLYSKRHKCCTQNGRMSMSWMFMYLGYGIAKWLRSALAGHSESATHQRTVQDEW